MTKYSGDFPISVHPGDILQEMLDEKSVSQSGLVRDLGTDVAQSTKFAGGVAASPRRWR